MAAIIKRELSYYFRSANGYVFLGIFYLFSGFYFFSTSLYQNSSSLTYLFNCLFTIILFTVYLLTMRLLSEEKKQKTDQLLLTSPVSVFEITMGKYISALIMYLISISVTLVYAVVIAFFTMPDVPVIIGSFIGLFLFGAALIAIGLFLSSLTENQFVAAALGLAVSLFIIFTDMISTVIKYEFISNIFAYMSFSTHYGNFSIGMISLADVVFFLSVITLFLFLTVRALDKRRFS